MLLRSKVLTYFNSTMVQLIVQDALKKSSPNPYFNSTMVQLIVAVGDSVSSQNCISILLWFN